MALVRIANLVGGYGGPPLLNHIDLTIERNDRIAIVGRNGAGKSTLLKILSGDVKPDSGELWREPGLKVATLLQQVPISLDGTVFDIVASGLGPAGLALADFHRAQHDNDDDALHAAQETLDHTGGWSKLSNVESTIMRLALDPDSRIDELSAGLKRRAMLGRALVLEPDLLLLDEPTNHLDIASIGWLEDFLLKWNGALLFVTHDRRFLDRLATRIIEVDRGNLRGWACNYATFLERREAELEAEVKQNALFDKRLAAEEVWIRTGIQARRTRNEGRVRALESLRNERSQRRERQGNVRFSVQSGERSGQLVVEALNISFTYPDGPPIVNDLSVNVMRGDRIGIVGSNGAGKTTLIRLLLSELAPTSGTVKLGTKLEVGYFDQLHAGLDEKASVQQNLTGADTMDVGGRPRHVIGYLQDFLFTPDRARSPVALLSGGERNRLLLAKLFARPANLLVLDEPTNDLDAETLELLEELVAEFAGTILVVSHDREFLNRTVTSMLVFEGEGVVKEYAGGFDDYVRVSGRSAPPTIDRRELVLQVDAAPAKPAAVAAQAPQPKPRKLSAKESGELSRLPATIERLEKEQLEIEARMASPGFYQSPPAEITKAAERLDAIGREIQVAFTRWTELDRCRT
ncbi:MAG: ATP-binding cassette domain-containing protein [Phycisphaerae bacterium]|nr:ATP-binding cassette domain-containing protein [Phycisphaerae bacterium]